MKKIPKFKTIGEMREFWEKHDFTDYAEDTEEAKIQFTRFKKAQVTFRLDPKDMEKIKQIAEEKGLSYTTLIRMWVKEKILEKRPKVA